MPSAEEDLMAIVDKEEFPPSDTEIDNDKKNDHNPNAVLPNDVLNAKIEQLQKELQLVSTVR